MHRNYLLPIADVFEMERGDYGRVLTLWGHLTLRTRLVRFERRPAVVEENRRDEPAEPVDRR